MTSFLRKSTVDSQASSAQKGASNDSKSEQANPKEEEVSWSVPDLMSAFSNGPHQAWSSEEPLAIYHLEQLQGFLKAKPADVTLNVARIEVRLVHSPPLGHPLLEVLIGLQDHLAADEFQKVFNTDKEEFYKLPVWKRNQKKKEVGLF